ncbi:hypothetical protein ABMA67_00565 [Halobacteriovorax sp. RZ-3]|uniref:hypothetical protein n=1 Tax=Halobacteriovorax sp. RZ-3 TaxID=3157720 RepID=UPI00371B0257
MRRLLKIVPMAIASVVLVSCNSSGGAGEPVLIEQTFSDTAVTAFEQTSGIAEATTGEEVINFVLPKAYAGGGDISCYSGERVSFQIDALGNTVQVDSTCSENIDVDIRRGLLSSLDGLAFYRSITDSSNRFGAIDFTSGGVNGGFQWDTPYTVAAVSDSSGTKPSGLNCMEKYTFNRALGTVVLEFDFDNSDAGCTGWTGQEVASFRFSNGFMEIDLTNTNTFDIDRGFDVSNGNAICDDATTNVNCESAYERWTTCVIGTNCYL